MELIKLEDKDYKKYYHFYKSIYKNQTNKKDDMASMLLSILKHKSAINKRIKMQPLLIYDKGQPIMGTVLAQVDDMSEFIQMSFFEASSYNQEAFNLLFEETKKMGHLWQAKKIAASLNIHVNYGLGFLKSHFEEQSSFGMNYNPDFYNTFFERTNFNTIDLVTYKQDMKKFQLPLSDRLLKRLSGKYTVRCMDYKHFKRDIKIYTDLNNNAFKDHLFYFKRNFEEDYELFKPFKILLKEENLLILEKEGKPVGFMLWYPDYNELIPPGKALSLKTLIDLKLLKKKISTFKIVEIGIIESEQKTGGILSLFDKLNQITLNKYAYCESSWILKDNTDSSSFGIKWSEGEYKTYAAYTRLLHDKND